MKLTDSTLAKLLGKKSGKTADLIVFDDDLPGFGLRIRASGSRTWIFQYKLGPQHRRITLGKYPALHPGQARKTAAKLYAEVRLGNDPAAIKAEKQRNAAETFGAVLKNYLPRRRGQVRDSTFGEIERHLRRNLAPLHGITLDKLDRRTIAAQLARVTNETGPTQANNTRASLSKFLNWCLAEGLTETNAALHTNKNPLKSRDRVLSEKELKTIWDVLPDNDYGVIVRLLILTGQRAAEIAELHWDEIDFDRNLIVLPPSRTKNGRRHSVPMSPMVRAILEARPQNGREFVFGSGQGGFSGWSKSKARLDAAVNIAPFVIHDIRRSAATHMAEIGVQPHIIEAVLNHVSGHKGGIAGVYNKAAYETEKATALSRWAEHVAAIVQGRVSNVTPLRA